MKMTINEARDFMVSYHFLNQEVRLSGKQGVLSIFERINSIQYDPLDVVGRNADLVLQARLSGFVRRDLHDLLYDDRVLVDGWDKMMGIYQMKDFEMMSPIRDARKQGELNRLKHRGMDDAMDYIDEVYGHIKESPKFASQISIGSSKGSRWSSGKVSTALLEYMFHSGQIGIKTKKGALREFDLIENILPKIEYCSIGEELSFEEYYLMRRLESMGLVWMKSSVAWSGPCINKKIDRVRILNQLLDKGLVTKVEIEGINNFFYIPTNKISIERKTINKMTILAPLDNFLWDRDLIKLLFNFDYKWEVYTPIKDRKYGYYVLPLLLGSSLVGRIEFEHYRGDLAVKGIWWESEAYEDELQIAIEDFKKYLA